MLLRSLPRSSAGHRHMQILMEKASIFWKAVLSSFELKKKAVLEQFYKIRIWKTAYDFKMLRAIPFVSCYVSRGQFWAVFWSQKAVLSSFLSYKAVFQNAICMYVCMYVKYVTVCMYLCIYVYMYLCMYFSSFSSTNLISHVSLHRKPNQNIPPGVNSDSANDVLPPRSTNLWVTPWLLLACFIRPEITIKTVNLTWRFFFDAPKHR